MSIGFGPGNVSKPLSRIMFEKFDRDGSGCISAPELRALCYDRGFPLSEEEVAAAMASLDKDGSGTLTYEEFLEWWRSDSRFALLQLTEAQQAVVAQIVEYFKHFDADCSGCLDEEEFLQLHADLLRNGLVEESAEEIIASMDRDSDGIVTLTEFLGWYISRGALAAHVQ